MEDFRSFLASWENAQNRFINGDPEPWKHHVAHTEDVSIFGAYGGREQGWKAVSERNDWVSRTFKDSSASQEIEYLNTIVREDVAITIAIERQIAWIEGQSAPTPRALRVTQFFRKEDGEWKMLHRHADTLVDQVPPDQRK